MMLKLAVMTVLALASVLVLCTNWFRTHQRDDEQDAFAKPRAALRGLQTMDGMSSEDPVISLAGSAHVAYTRWEWNTAGVWQHQHVLARPGWQKTTRCTTNSSMSCEECTGKHDCWTGSDAVRQVALESGADHFARYLTTIHVRCSSPTLSVKYEVQDLHYGRLRILWDGVDVSQQWSVQPSGLATPLEDQDGTYQSVAEPSARSGSLFIVSEHAGSHSLELEFTPFSDKSNIQLSKLELMMPKTYADCEDYKSCLDPISASHELRNNNSLQLKCLQEEVAFSEECSRWRGCLTDKHRDQLRILLVAAGVGGYDINVSSPAKPQETATSVTNSGPPPPEKESDEGNTTNETDVLITSALTAPAPSSPHAADWEQCLNPLVQDAESWACDCFEELQRSCVALAAQSPLYTYEVCVRAKLCTHSSICPSWKEHACDEPHIQATVALLEGVEPAVRRRALLSTREGDATTFDRTLLDKSCV